MSESKFGSPLVDMLIADGAVTQPSVMGELMRERFEGDRRIRQTESGGFRIPARSAAATGK